MKERGLWRLWSTFLLLLAGSLQNSMVQCQSYDGARGDDGNSASLGFDDVVRRHDGYVKGETPTIPQTSFSCSAQPYNPGLYADVETQCQVYHVCFEDRQESFLCGPGTNFNQRILACDFWYNFDCQDSPSFYNANADIGKVPETIFRPGQERQPSRPAVQPPSRPSYPSYPQPAQPPSGGSYPTRVSVPPPPPPPQPQPQPPRIPQEPIQPQPPRVSIQPPRISPQPPAFRPEPPSVYPQPPAPRPDPPRVYPEPPAPRPEPPRVYPQPPAPRPDPPRVYPQPPAPRPDPPRVSVQPQYPRIPEGSVQPAKVRPPPPQQLPPTQQEEDNGYHFDGYTPQRPSLPPPPPPREHTPRPVFPPVVSPPRVSRPPLTPPFSRQPEISRPRPAVVTTDTRSEFHPDSHLKGSGGYQPPRQPQPSRPVGSGYPSYPVAQRPVTQIHSEKPSRPAYQPPSTVQQEHVDTEYVPPPPPPRPKEPSRPQTTYVPPPPPPRPKEPSRPQTTYVPPPPPPRPKEPSRPQTTYVPPPPPPRPKEPSRPQTTYVPPPPPPPPRPVQQEVTNVDFTKPPQPSRPVYVPPPIVQKPVDRDYGRPQPPVAPSVIREQQKPAIAPPSRPQVSVGVRQPQPPSRPKPVFPPASDHPNSNIKGGPGYNQPPPQIPRFEPTRISRPSSPQGGYQPPPQPPRTEVKPTVVKTPVATGQGSYKPPVDRVKKPSDPPRTVYQPPIQVIDHPRSEIKGVAYDPPRQPSRVQSPSSPVTGVKRPQTTVHQQPQVQRPRAPVVVARPQPPSLPTTSVKTKTSPVNTQVYEKPKPQAPAPSRVKLPSTSQVQVVSRPSQPRFPTYEDHPNANVKGGSGYTRPISVTRPSGPPPSPSVSYEQKTTSTHPGHGSGTGYPSYPTRGDGGSVQHVVQQEDYKPSRSSPPSSIKTVQKITAVKDTSSYQKPVEVSQHSVLFNKQSKPDYEAGSSYTRGPETYPKPEFGKPHTPVSTPSRVSPITKQGSPSQNTITRSQNKPAFNEPSVSTGSGSRVGAGSDVRPDYPFNQVPGHQPPNQRQVFPHRENPDHPNESLKGSGAYRPPPPAGFQAAASEVQEQVVEPEPEPSSALHGDTGSE